MNERKPGISSALGSVNRSDAGIHSRKVLTVNDPTVEENEEVFTRSFYSENFENNSNNIEIENVLTQEELDELARNREKLQNVRKSSQQQRNRIPEGLKQRLEILTGIGRLTEDVKVDNVTFSIRSLKPVENEEIIKAVSGIEFAGVQAFEIRAQTLARAIYKIDGQNIDVVIEAKSFNDKIVFVKNILEESLVNFLYGRYQNILNKNKEKFNELGKTEEEVIENVKKL